MKLTSWTNLKLGHKIGGKPNAISPRLLRSFPHRGPLIRLGWPFLSWIHTKRVNNKTETCVPPTKNIKFQTKILFGHLSNEVNCFPHWVIFLKFSIHWQNEKLLNWICSKILFMDWKWIKNANLLLDEYVH